MYTQVIMILDIHTDGDHLLRRTVEAGSKNKYG